AHHFYSSTDPPPQQISPLSLHDALPISTAPCIRCASSPIPMCPHSLTRFLTADFILLSTSFSNSLSASEPVNKMVNPISTNASPTPLKLSADHLLLLSRAPG